MYLQSNYAFQTDIKLNLNSRELEKVMGKGVDDSIKSFFMK